METIQILAIITSVSFLAFVFHNVRGRHIREEYSLLWFLAALFFVFVAVFRDSIVTIAELLDVYYAPSALFIVAFFFVTLISFHLTKVTSRLSDHTRRLAQELAILEARLQHLEDE